MKFSEYIKSINMQCNKFKVNYLRKINEDDLLGTGTIEMFNGIPQILVGNPFHSYFKYKIEEIKIKGIDRIELHETIIFIDIKDLIDYINHEFKSFKRIKTNKYISELTKKLRKKINKEVKVLSVYKYEYNKVVYEVIAYIQFKKYVLSFIISLTKYK